MKCLVYYEANRGRRYLIAYSRGLEVVFSLSNENLQMAA